MITFLLKFKNTIKKAALFIVIFSSSILSAQITYIFTNASATGNIGPTAPQITAAYLATNLNGSVTVSGGIQSFTIPITGPYGVEVIGAGGGGVAPGLGAKMYGEFNFTAGTVLKIIVGQKGILESGYTRNLGASGGGGGGSFVVDGGVTPLVIAGGGGGSGCDNAGTPGIIVPSAVTTGPLNNGGTFGEGNSGAGFIGNGALGLHMGNVISFSFLNGGVGGVGYSGGGIGYGGFGGGGGEGYADGGGGGGVSGGNSNGDGDGGDGGGSLNTGINQSNTAGFNIGEGSVKLTLLYSVAISQTATISCNSFSTAVLSATVNGGLAPYTYTWAPMGGNTAIASGLPAGTYTCFVRDALSNPTSNTYTITQPATFTISAIASNSSICNGSSTVLNGVGVGASTFTWTGGITDGIAFSPSVTTTYSLTSNNALGCQSTNTAVITVSVSSNPSITVNSGTICAGKSFTIIPAGASSYTIQGGSSVVNPIVNTTYTVLGTNAAGCISSIVTSSLNINANPIFSITPTSTLNCSLLSALISTTVSPSIGINYTWSGPGISGPTTGPTISANAPGVYSVTIINASTGCSVIATTSVQSSSALPTLSLTSTNTLITCSSPTISLTAISSITNTIVWSTPTGTISNPCTADVAGSYSYSVTDPTTGCTNTQMLSIYGSTTAPIPLTTNTAIPCGVNNLMLTATSTPSNGVSFLWTGPGVITNPTSSTPTITQPGLYLVAITNTLTGCSSTTTVIVSPGTITAAFTADPSSGIAPLTVNCTDLSINATNFEWFFGNGSTSTLQNPSTIYNSNGTYTIMLIATNGSCSDTTYATIVINDDLSIEIPNVFTPNGDGANDFFKIKSTGAKEISLTIFNRWGEKLYESSGVEVSWDGFNNGKKVSDGNYFYFVKAIGFNDKVIEKQGSLNLFK